MQHSISDEIRYRLLRYLEECPTASQREVARALGVSLGKVNYCLRALIAKGLVKVRNFKKSQKKIRYAYLLTPKGIEEKIEITYAFLRRKTLEYQALQEEIARLTAEVGSLQDRSRTER